MKDAYSNPRYNDLEERTMKFARDVRDFVRKAKSDPSNWEDCKQLIRSSGSVGANYIEANDAISPKDFSYRVKISKKEAKESRFWLSLIVTDNPELNKIRIELIDESVQLMKILGAILIKYKEKSH